MPMRSSVRQMSLRDSGEELVTVSSDCILLWDLKVGPALAWLLISLYRTVVQICTDCRCKGCMQVQHVIQSSCLIPVMCKWSAFDHSKIHSLMHSLTSRDEICVMTAHHLQTQDNPDMLLDHNADLDKKEGARGWARVCPPGRVCSGRDCPGHGATGQPQQCWSCITFVTRKPPT